MRTSIIVTNQRRRLVINLQLIGETPTEYVAYCRDLVRSTEEFIKTLEKTAEDKPQLKQEIAEVLVTQQQLLTEYKLRLKGAMSNALSSKKTSGA